MRRILRSRGAPASTIDDAIQTAAERALRRTGAFDGLDGWMNWTVKVAWHEVEGQWRRQARAVPGESPEQSCEPDPARVIEGRIALQAVAGILATLGEPERQAILSSLDDGLEADHRLSTAEKVRRHRARRRLEALAADWVAYP